MGAEERQEVDGTGVILQAIPCILPGERGVMVAGKCRARSMFGGGFLRM